MRKALRLLKPQKGVDFQLRWRERDRPPIPSQAHKGRDLGICLGKPIPQKRQPAVLEIPRKPKGENHLSLIHQQKKAVERKGGTIDGKLDQPLRGWHQLRLRPSVSFQQTFLSMMTSPTERASGQDLGEVQTGVVLFMGWHGSERHGRWPEKKLFYI